LFCFSWSGNEQGIIMTALNNDCMSRRDKSVARSDLMSPTSMQAKNEKLIVEEESTIR